MDFKKVLDVNNKSAAEFVKAEPKKWDVEICLVELSKQMGDLAKCIMVVEQNYAPQRKNDPNYQLDKNNIGDELADIFHFLVRIANIYNIDLEKAIVQSSRDGFKFLGKEKEINF